MKQMRKLYVLVVVGGIMLVGCGGGGGCEAPTCLPEVDPIPVVNDTMQGGLIDENGTQAERAIYDAVEWLSE